MEKQVKNELERLAVKCRLNVLRMLKASHHGHLGGAFSCIDIVTAIYFYKGKFNSNNPGDKNRDRFLLSAGHKSMAQYAVLAEKGYFEKAGYIWNVKVKVTGASGHAPITGSRSQHRSFRSWLVYCGRDGYGTSDRQH